MRIDTSEKKIQILAGISTFVTVFGSAAGRIQK